MNMTCREAAGSQGILSNRAGLARVALMALISAAGVVTTARADDQGWVPPEKKAVSTTQPSATLAGPKVDAGSMNPEGPQRQFGGGAGKGNGEERERMIKLLQSLNLSLDQKEKISAIFAQSREDRASWRKENQEKLRALRAQIDFAKDEQNHQRIKDLMGQVKDILATAPKLMTYVEKVNVLLTPEQLAKFKEGIKVIIQDSEENRHKDGEGKGGSTTQPSLKPMAGSSEKMMEGDKMMAGEKMTGDKPPATNKKPAERNDKLNL